MCFFKYSFIYKGSKIGVHEPEIVNLKTAQTIKDNKRKIKKKSVKKKVDIDISKHKIIENRKKESTTGTYCISSNQPNKERQHCTFI